MLFVSWQLKTTVYVIFLASCLGQELFRTCEQDYCLGRSINRERFDQEQSRRLSNKSPNLNNERNNRILGTLELSLAKETARHSEIIRGFNRETTRRFDYITGDDHNRKLFDTTQERLAELEPERFLDKRDHKIDFKNNRKENDKIVQRFDANTNERLTNRESKNSRKEERQLEASIECFSPQEFEERSNNENKRKETNYKHLERCDDSSHERISDRGFENNREERRANLEERRLTTDRELSDFANQRYENFNQKQVNRKKTLQRFDGRYKNENFPRSYRNEGEENERRSNENNEMSRRSEHTDEASVHRISKNEQRERNTKRNSYHLNERTASKIVLSNYRQIPQDVQKREEVSKERRAAYRASQRSENGRDISHRQDNLLRICNSESQETVCSRRSENSSPNRRVDESDATERSVSNRQQFQEAFRRVNDRRNFDIRASYRNLDTRSDPVTQNREKLEQNPRQHENQDARGQRIVRLEDEREKHLSQLNTRQNEEMGERSLERRFDREALHIANGNLAGPQQHVVKQTETRLFNERGIKTNSHQTRRLGVPEPELTETSRHYNRRDVRYDEKHERDSVRNNERIEERHVERLENDHRDFQSPDKQRLERRTQMSAYKNNRFIEEDEIKTPTVLPFNTCTALGQGLLFAYVVMKTFNGKTDLRTQLQTKMHEALEIIGF